MELLEEYENSKISSEILIIQNSYGRRKRIVWLKSVGITNKVTGKDISYAQPRPDWWIAFICPSLLKAYYDEEAIMSDVEFDVLSEKLVTYEIPEIIKFIESGIYKEGEIIEISTKQQN